MRMMVGNIRNKKLNHSQNKKQIPPWERRLKKQIDDLRKDIGRVQQAQRGNTSNRIIKLICTIKKKYTYTPNMIQAMFTPRKYLIPSSISYLQSHKSSGGTKKQTKATKQAFHHQ